MNADMMVLQYFGGLCVLALLLIPIFLLLQIARDVRKIRLHHDRLYHTRQ
jgi:hypothetical protein